MNFRGILSKTSLKSSSSGKSLPQPGEFSRLQSEIELLKQTIDSLKVSVESRDAAIGTLAREKEKIFVELKSAQRTNRNLHQQLVDERDIHSKEKEFLITEIKRLSKRNEHGMNSLPNQDGHEDQPKALLYELKAKDEIIYNIGAKYMKIKASKHTLQKKFEKLQVQNKKMCENIIFLLQDNRNTLHSLLDNVLASSTTSSNNKKYLSLLQINANLHYENTQLKVLLSAKDVSHSKCIKKQEQPDIRKPWQTDKQFRSGIKSEVKVKNTPEKIVTGRHRSICPKLRSLNSYEFLDIACYNFIHETVTPKFRFNLYRSVSDPCIIRKI